MHDGYKLNVNKGSYTSPHRCRPHAIQRVATWNVEGLSVETGTKLLEIQRWMRIYEISIICIQETHCKGSSYFVDNGFLVVLSGVEDMGSARSYAGVGFVVAPWARHAVEGFTQYDDRLASIRVRIYGGQLTLVSLYAPHNNHNFEFRHEFYTCARSFILSQRCHGPTIALGDFNARLHFQQSGEEYMIGPGVFGNPNKLLSPTDNRELLLELCESIGCCIANTFFDHAPVHLATYRDLGTLLGAPIDFQHYAQLDHVLIPHKW
jgi:exonuclease III